MNDRVPGRYFYRFDFGLKLPATSGSPENEFIQDKWLDVARTQQFMLTLRESSKHQGTAPPNMEWLHEPSYELI